MAVKTAWNANCQLCVVSLQSLQKNFLQNDAEPSFQPLVQWYSWPADVQQVDCAQDSLEFQVLAQHQLFAIVSTRPELVHTNTC